MMMNTEKTLEKREPLPLESLQPLPERNIGREWEKGMYWNSLLTGNPETVPLEVRRKAGAEHEGMSPEEREYKLASGINRSWVVDHTPLGKEQVQAAWPELRRNMAQELEVMDDEREVYAGLSLRHEQEKTQKLYFDSYESALKGEEKKLPEDAGEHRVAALAREEAGRTRAEYMPLAESLSQGWAALKSMESDLFALPDMISGAPGLVEAVDALAEMPPGERAKVYEIARSLDSSRKLDEGDQSLGRALLRSTRRGVADLRHSLIQGVGHVGAALTHAAGETLGSETLKSGAKALDKRLQALHELRRVAQGEVYPIDLGEDSSFAEELALDVAGATPAVAMAFMGGAGFGALTLAGTGAAVAEARRRSPEGRQELQTAAGIVGGALQAGIYMGMSRIGAQMLNRSINNFLKARNAGVKGYSLAALQTLGALTAENAKLLLAGKAAHAAELGMQELAARVDRVASNIDWQSYGENLVDIETNMREAAMNLPFILIAAGRAALHHFRSPDIVLDNREKLAEWGVDDALLRRIVEAPDSQTQTELLRKALSGSRRWGGAGSLEECVRALRLLNTDYHTDFSNEQVVRQFLNLPSELSRVKRPPLIERDMSDPETVRRIAESMNEQSSSQLSRSASIHSMQLWDEWNQRGQGDRFRNEENFNASVKRYQEMHADPKAGVPREFRLDGYYSPHRAKVVQVLRNDLMSEMIDLSYQYLMNTESLSSLNNSYKSAEQARSQTELKRRVLISKLCEAISKCVQSDDSARPFDEFCQWLSGRYENRRRAAKHPPMWFRKTQRQDFQDMYPKALHMYTRFSKQKPPQLRDSYRIMLGLRSCGETLVQLFPHAEDFQEVLSMGYSPEQAVQHLLARDLREHLDVATWNPEPLDSKSRNTIDNERRFHDNKKLCNRYFQLSGRDLESTPDGKGGQLWRITRPDGEVTPWFPSYGHAVNSLVGNVKSKFLPMGKGLIDENIANSYRYLPNGKRTFYNMFMFRLPHGKFTGFDHLGRVASDDLREQWLGESTMYPVGLEIAADKQIWKRFKGKTLRAGVKEIKDGNDGFLVRQRKVETPLTLSQLRFFVYWHRMLSSGWVSPETVCNALVEAGEMHPDVRNELVAQAQEKPLYLENKTREERRRLLEMYPDMKVPGDLETVNSELARRMADLNVLYFLADLPQAKVPKSVREWCYTSAFADFAVPTDNLGRQRGAVRMANRAGAEEIQHFVPRVMSIRDKMKSGEAMKLVALMRDAYLPNEARRYEQGWCYSVGGDSAFCSAGQTFWNLLEDPARGWKLLTPNDREMLQEEIRDFCEGRSPEETLQELSEVLQKYPGLRAYASDRRYGGQLKRMVLDPIRETGITKPTLTHRVNTRLLRPLIVQKGYRVVDVERLPAEWEADSRVLPALQLLTELRRNVTATPYVDEHGICLRQERYGGKDGKRPRGLTADWTPEIGVQTFMTFYERADAMAREYGTQGKLNVCGVPLGGIKSGDIDDRVLRHVTIYTNPLRPEHQVRLMPGDPNAANPYHRKPYVLHTADGIPLLPTRIARTQAEVLQAYAPLNHFQSDIYRMYDYETNRRWRRNRVQYYLRDLLGRRASSEAAWYKADESSINNAEFFMQLFQDSRLSYYLEKKDPTQLTRGEALASELARLMLLAEFGRDREAGVRELVAFCSKLKENWEDQELMEMALLRLVSPDPNTLSEEERSRSEENRKLDLSSEDAEYY